MITNQISITRYLSLKFILSSQLSELSLYGLDATMQRGKAKGRASFVTGIDERSDDSSSVFGALFLAQESRINAFGLLPLSSWFINSLPSAMSLKEQ